MNTTAEPNTPGAVLRARIALLATAIGGPDYNSQLDPPPYKLGDDCLACLKDLKRWFKLVDDQQNRWDVAMAAAEYRILTDDLLPIMIDWGQKSSLSSKLAAKNKTNTTISTVDGNSSIDISFKNKFYHDKIALNCLQLMVLMTWPLILTDQSTKEQVTYYSELKKHQLIYKKVILTLDDGYALRAVLRLAFDVIKIDRMERTPHDNMVLRLVLNFLRNIVAIEPGELTITTKKRSSKGINATDTLPPNVSFDDISLNTVISSFHRNKVFSLLLTLGSSVSSEFDQDFINIPLLEVMFYLTKDVNQKKLFADKTTQTNSNTEIDTKQSDKSHISSTGLQLSDLLAKEHQLKKNVIKNTSTRHSRFGALLSIQTPENGRLTVSGSQGLLDDSKALQKLDNSKKWNKRIMQDKDDIIIEGLPNNLFNSESNTVMFYESTMKNFKIFIENFIDSSFNVLLISITSHFTTEQDKMVTLEQIEYLLYFSWFIKFQRIRYQHHQVDDFSNISTVYNETSFIFMSSLLRTSYEEKNWIVVHAGMIAFNELLLLTQLSKEEINYEDIEYLLSRLFSDERIQLLSSLPKLAYRHSVQFMKSAIELTHTILKTLKAYSDDKKLVIEGKPRRNNKSKQISREEIEKLMEEEGVGRDEAIEILTLASIHMEVNFVRVQSRYMTESTIDTYIRFLQRYRELADESIKKVVSFFHTVFIDSKEQTLLFRIDLIMLLREILSTDGLSRTCKSRKHIEQFSIYYLSKLKKKFKSSPAWIVGILFSSLHDTEVGYYQKYGKEKVSKKDIFNGVPPSCFKPIENESTMSVSDLKTIQLGILVSTLLDDGKNEIINFLKENLNKAIENFRSWSIEHNSPEESTETPPNENFTIDDSYYNESLLMDQDFRALLDLIGYSIPLNRQEECHLTGTKDIINLIDTSSIIDIHLRVPFETPNGLPSSSYLIRPRLQKADNHQRIDGDQWNSMDDYDYNGPDIVPDDEGGSDNNNDYFRDLEGMDNSLSNKNISKGIARSKKQKKSKQRSKKNLPAFDSVDNTNIKSISKSRLAINSKEFISDSDDEDDDLNSIFFENEMYMRWLLDKHNGQIPEDKFTLFSKFSKERMNNKGVVINDYSSLFGGLIPNLSNIDEFDINMIKSDKSRYSRTYEVGQELEAPVMHAPILSSNTENSGSLYPGIEDDQNSSLSESVKAIDTDLSDSEMNSSNDYETELTNYETNQIFDDESRKRDIHQIKSLSKNENNNSATNYSSDSHSNQEGDSITFLRKKQKLIIDDDDDDD